MMTMKEVIAHVEAKNKQRAKEHRENVTQGDYCSGLSDKEYRKMKFTMKGAGSKSRSFAHTKLWRDHVYKKTTPETYYATL